MDNNYQGDLADIVRASGGVIRTTADATTSTITGATTTTATTNDQQMPDWRFRSSNPDPYPFPNPLLTNMDAITSTGSMPPFIDIGVKPPRTTFYGGGSGLMNNFGMFSKALQISPDMPTCNNDNSTHNSSSTSNNNWAKSRTVAVASPKVIKEAYGLMSSEMMNINRSSSGEGFLDSSTSGVQIPSLRNPGIKRRKSQAKKVVCIPAPAGANGRQSGEVVPSDLWAWRKYGQKPIKGSPYPRGYYRCSSSKGCSARKQVERSRTDPNMLVITYTSEHNHHWPTQRNGLAGSTRSQRSKITPAAASMLKPPPSSSNEALVKEEINSKEESQENNNDEDETRSENQVEDKGEYNADDLGNEGDEPSFSDSYRPIMPEPSSKQPQQNYFDDLGFDGDDPLNLIFTQESKTLDPFSGLFDSGATTRTTNAVAESNDHDNTSTIMTQYRSDINKVWIDTDVAQSNDHDQVKRVS